MNIDVFHNFFDVNEIHAFKEQISSLKVKTKFVSYQSF